MSDVPMKRADEPPGFFDWSRNGRRVIQLLVVSCVLVVLLDVVLRLTGVLRPHAFFGVDGLVAFYAVYGFVGLVVLVAGSVVLRQLVMRPEDIHDE